MGRHQDPKIIHGLRQLCERQKPGQCFSTYEIARACGTEPQHIGRLERAALKRVGRLLANGDTADAVRNLYPEFNRLTCELPKRIAA